jgi:hypothetical protein
MNQTAVSRIWRAFGLKPHLTEAFKLSTDPQFIGKETADQIPDAISHYCHRINDSGHQHQSARAAAMSVAAAAS